MVMFSYAQFLIPNPFFTVNKFHFINSWAFYLNDFIGS